MTDFCSENTSVSGTQTKGLSISTNRSGFITQVLWQRPGKLLQSAGWLLGAQFSSRLARLITTLVVARLLSPEHFGLAAVALATNELANVVARFGTSSAIVQCDNDELESRCRTAWGLNWILGISLFSLQCAAAIPIAIWYESPQLILPICALACSYLLLPLASVNQALTLRRSDMKTVARSEVLQAISDMFLTVVLAVAGLGVWALILPKVLVVPIWVVSHRRASPWKTSGFTLENSAPLIGFSHRVLCVELLTVLRNNIDYILIGSFLGIEALGIYYFAFNAGLGITRGVIGAMSSALYPALCESRSSIENLNRRFRQGLVIFSFVVVSCVALQVSLAPWYVPVLFSEKWVDFGAVPVLMLICLSAIPVAFVDAGTQYLRARGLLQRDVNWHLPYTALFTIGLLAGLNWGITGVAISVLIVQLLNMPLYYFFNIMPVMKKDSKEVQSHFQESLANA